MKRFDGYVYIFCCDKCGEIAGMHENEREALRIAQIVSSLGWKWQHPHWVLICPNCKRKVEK